MQPLKPVLSKVYKLSSPEIDNMTFSQMSSYADNILSNTFEGIDLKYDFTPNEMRAAYEIVKWTLTDVL